MARPKGYTLERYHRMVEFRSKQVKSPYTLKTYCREKKRMQQLIVFVGCLLLLFTVVFLLHCRNKTCGRTSCLLRLRFVPSSIQNVEHRFVYQCPRTAEQALHKLSQTKPNVRCLLCRNGGQWSILGGTELSVTGNDADGNSAGPDPNLDFFYLLQTAPLTTTSSLPPARPIIKESFQPPVVTSNQDRLALRQEFLTQDKLLSTRHGTIISARDEFYRQWEQNQSQGSVFLLQSLQPNDAAYYVLASKKKLNLDDVFLKTPNGYVVLVDQRGG